MSWTGRQVNCVLLFHFNFKIEICNSAIMLSKKKVEYSSRVDFLWKSKLKVEQEEVETMGGINKILLENILPAHVADHFLTGRKSTDVRSMNCQMF